MTSRINAIAYACAFCALAVFLSYSGANDLYNSIRFALDGVAVEGRAVRVNQVNHSGSSDHFNVQIQFTDRHRQDRRLGNRHPYSYLFVPAEGDPIAVHYLRGDARVAMPSTFWGSLFGPSFSLLIGVFFGWMAIEQFGTTLTGKER